MNVFDWLNKTKPKQKGWKERPEHEAHIAAMRARVLERAGVTLGVLTNAKSRGSVGNEVTRRMIRATHAEGEGWQINEGTEYAEFKKELEGEAVASEPT
jgi:hypothetical protein